jgi:hypothetical protein
MSMDKPMTCKTAGYNNDKGILAGPFIFSVFVGLLLVVVLYPFVMKLDFSSRLRHGIEGSILIAVLLVTLLAYQAVKAIRIRKFVKGAEAPLLVRELKADCLQGDIGSLEKLLVEQEDSDIHVLLILLQAKAENILQTEIAHMTDIHKKIGLRIFSKKSHQSYHMFFKNPDEYALASLPKEIALLKNAVRKEWPLPMLRQVKKLENARRALFTLFDDYLDIIPEQKTHLRFIRQTYKYRSPEAEISRKITYCLDVFDCVDRLKEKDFDSLPMSSLEAVARRRIPLLRKAVDRYREAWEKIVVTYETRMLR